MFREVQFDVIHVHDLPLSKIGVEFKEKYSIKLIIDLHENYPAAMEEALHTKTILGRVLSSNRQWRIYEKKILKHADLIITVIEEMKERIAALGIDEKKIIIVPNTLEDENFIVSKKNPNPDYITLFYAGGVNVHRGLQIAIKGLKEVVKKHPQIRLWIIGPGSYIETLKQITTDLNLEQYVELFFSFLFSKDLF